MTNQSPLVRKLAEVMGSVERLEKTGTAPQSMGGFAFVREPDVYDAVRSKLATLGIVPRVRTISYELREAGTTEKGKVVWCLHGLFEVGFTDGQNELVHTVPMMAIDYGDKAAQKALSNAVKYAVLKAFLISTGQDDAESHEVEVQPRVRRITTRTTAPAPPPAANGTPTGGVPDPPTREQLGKLRELAAELGKDLERPKTRAEAGAQIRTLQHHLKLKQDAEATAPGARTAPPRRVFTRPSGPEQIATAMRLGFAYDSQEVGYVATVHEADYAAWEARAKNEGLQLEVLA